MGERNITALSGILLNLVDVFASAVVDSTLDKLKPPARRGNDASVADVDDYAGDLLAFKRWCEDRELNFRQVMRQMIHRQMGDPAADAREPVLLEASPPETPEPAAPAPPAAARKSTGVSPVLCVERPGERFTLEQAAELAGRKRHTVLQSLTPSNQLRRGGRVGRFHFYREGQLAPAAVSESPPPATSIDVPSASTVAMASLGPEKSQTATAYLRRRGGSDAMPINPMRLAAGDKPIPEEFRADPINEPKLHKRLQCDYHRPARAGTVDARDGD